jgi:hypothetical protein
VYLVFFRRKPIDLPWIADTLTWSEGAVLQSSQPIGSEFFGFLLEEY